MTHPSSGVPGPEFGNPFKATQSRRQLLAIGGLGLGSLLLTACGGNSGPSAAASSSAAAVIPKKGGTLKVSISDGASDESLDPGLILSTNSQTYCSNIYDYLVSMDAASQLHPALATSWKVTPDARQWTFNLRKGVKWHDGTDFTSKDVVFTITQRWLDPKAANQASSVVSPFLDASGVTAPDDHTVVLKLKKPNSVLPYELAGHYSTRITKAGVTDFSLKNAIGTGPFIMKTWTPGTHWTAVRNNDYWGGAPYLDGLSVTVTPDQGAKLQAMLAGSTDVTDTIPISLWAGLQGHQGVTLEPIPGKNNWVFAFDQRKAPFNDQRVIDALKLATDRDTILKVALQGHGTVVADVAATPDSPYYPPGLTPEFDSGKAKALLAQAGFANGLDIELSTTSSVPGMIDVAQAWQQVVKNAGINVTLKQYSANDYWSKGWMQTPAYQDYWNHYFPSGIIQNFYSKSGSWDECFFEDPALDQLTDQIHAETNTAKQTALLQQAFLQGRKTFAYVIPLYADSAYARGSSVNGVIWDYISALNFSKTSIA